jgi:anhydro-N-acetylmuramic acid kinase
MCMPEIKKDRYRAIGIMSGTSLDGLDLVCAVFRLKNEGWTFEIEKAETFPYSKTWQKRLSEAHLLSAENLLELDRDFALLIAKNIREFLPLLSDIDLIASHGHTVFHQPEKSLNLQIGNPHIIAAQTGLSCVADFRSLDIAMGGQGAPLVPAGDALLFNDYAACLNLGGFANISIKKGNTISAFDICPVNIIIQFLCRKIQLPMDIGGREARKGQTDTKLLKALNAITYYREKLPKTLGREWVEKEIIPVLMHCGLDIHVQLRTVYEHIACQISLAMQEYTDSSGKDCLISGGGTHNTFLVELLRKKCPMHIKIPHPLIIDFKEALIFAFLGILRQKEEINCFASVTGARKDTCCGIVVIRP